LSYAPVWHQSSTSPRGPRTHTLHLPTRQKRGYMGRHVERGSCPTPTPASARAAGKEFPSSSKLLEQTAPQTRFPAAGFHRRPVGSDRGRGVGGSNASHQVAGGAVRPTSAHQTRQRFSRTMGAPALQANAFWNSGILETTPLARYLAGECGSTVARSRCTSGRSALHQLWP